MVIKALLDATRNQTGHHAHYDATGAVRSVTTKPAASAQHHSLSAIELTAPNETLGHYFADALPREGSAAGASITLPTYLAAASRVVSHGATLIVQPEASEAVVGSNGALAFQRRDVRFGVIAPAPFTEVPDGDELTASALPLLTDALDLETIPTYGFQTVITRADVRHFADGLFSSAAMLSIAIGLGRIADATLLDAVTDSAPATFSLGAAAAAGFNFSELRALIGTSGTGASVDTSGVLRAAGIEADLTPASAATVIGAFSRAAVVFSDRISFTAERINTNGDCTLTCWCNAQALMPQPGAFWKAA
jgi:hypothetical protein